MEYQRFGNTIVQREEGSIDDFVPVPEDDIKEAEISVRVNEKIKELPRPRLSLEIIRDSRNILIGEKLGLGLGDKAGDNLAEALNNNQDIKTERMSDIEFNADMAELGLSPEEAKARFKGTWDKELT